MCMCVCVCVCVFTMLCMNCGMLRGNIFVLMFGFCVLCFFRGVGFAVHCIASFGGLVLFFEWTFTVLLPRNGVCILLLWLKLLARRRSLFCLSLRLGGSVVSVDRYIQSIAISMNLISRYPYPLQTISGDIRRRYLIPTNLFPTQNKPHMHRNSAAPSHFNSTITTN